MSTANPTTVNRSNPSSKLHIPAAKSTVRPTSVADVDEAMKEMDRIHETTFKAWIQSEANIGYVCTYKRALFDRYMKEDRQTLALVLRWMSLDWSMASFAEMMLKLFYKHKVESRKFTHLLAAVAADWSPEKKAEAANVLLIGETATSTAKFVKHYLEGFKDEKMDAIQVKIATKEEILALVTTVATLLRWNDVFMMDFITEYASLLFTDPVQRAVTIVKVLQRFESLAEKETPATIVKSVSRTPSERTLNGEEEDVLSDDSMESTDVTEENEEIRRQVAEMMRPKSRFRTFRESIALGMKVFAEVLEAAEAERNVEVASDKLLSSLSLNSPTNPLFKCESRVVVDGEVIATPKEE
ncbi:hypothetical protein BC830DRAFT_1166922 [Chytriomyces sp. MP71]|nr:hypothetical protein BC830DRAFT_1166922 [Chytriomyces sp. MP71]